MLSKLRYMNNLGQSLLCILFRDLFKFDIKTFTTNITHNGNKSIEIGLRATVSPTHFRWNNDIKNATGIRAVSISGRYIPWWSRVFRRCELATPLHRLAM